MSINQYLPFGVAGGANVLAPAAYQALSSRLLGFVAGEAESINCNTVWRQSSVISAMIGEFVGDFGSFDANDDGDVAALELSFARTLQLAPWRFAVATGTATALVATLDPAPLSYTGGMEIAVQAISVATGPATINLNGLGAKAVVDSSGAPIIAGFWQANNILTLTYDGTSFKVIAGQTTVSSLFTTTYATTQSLSNGVYTQSALTTGSTDFGAVASNTFTFTRKGIYSVSASVTTSLNWTGPSNAIGDVQVRKNGSPIPGATNPDGNYGNGTTTFVRSVNGVVIAANAGDTITVYGYVGASSGFSSGSITNTTLTILPLS